MKRNLLIFSILLLAALYSGCKKNNTEIAIPFFKDPFIASAFEYLKTQISNDDLGKLNLNNIQLMKTGGITTGIIIPLKDTSDHKSLILGKHNNKFIGNWLNFESNNAHKNGVIITESFNGNLKNKVFFLLNYLYNPI